MGLLSAYMHNVRANRGAELAFAINQREEAEARDRMQRAEDERLWNSLASGNFGDTMAAAWTKDAPGSVWSPNMPASAFTAPAPMAPEPPLIPGAPQQQPALGSKENLSRILGRMKGTAGRMAGNSGLLNGATRPPSRVQ
jgi:hypothetical protein